MLLHYRRREIICIDLLCSIHTTIDFDLVDLRSCRHSLFSLMSWLSENKQKIQTRALVSEYKQTIEIIQLDQKISELIVHSDLQEILRICWTIKEISQELREVSILMSKSQQWVCFNDTHRQCNDSSTLIVLLISESIRLLIHVQLVSLLQWHDNVFNNKQIFELVSILKSQWVCFNDILNAMIYSLSSFYSSVNRFCYSFTCN